MVGKKSNQFQDINYAIVAKTHTPMYLMHKYWARKPHNVVSEYIKHYSRVGEIVLDPFVGSGVTAIEALKLNRRAIGLDLDPMAIFISRETAKPLNLKKFKEEFENIKQKVQNKIYDLYKTECEKCKNETVAEAIIWKNNEPKEIRYTCPCTKGVQWKKVSNKDLNLVKEIEKKNISYWYPKVELIPNSRINVKSGEKVQDLFTKRNLLALSMILNEIEKIEDKEIKDTFKFVFTSALGQASKMVFVIRNRGRASETIKYTTPEVGSWATRGYWIPSEYFEINAWNCFEERFFKVLRGKEESNKLITKYKEAKDFSQLNVDANILFKVQNVLELDKIIPPNSIDYVFTDPPYGDSVPYLELDYMWSSWLKFNPNFEDEIVISDSPKREKTEEVYERMLKVAFDQIFKILKPGKYMTVTFHNTSINVWNNLLSACIYAGFDLEKIIYQPPARPSPKGLLAPYGSAVGDYYLRFKKPISAKELTQTSIDEERYKRIVVEAAKKIIAERGEPTPYTFILNGIIVELKKEGALLLGNQNPNEIMKSFLGKEFILVDVKNEKGKVIGKKWWFKDPSSIPYLDLVPLMDRVETSIVEILRRKVKVSFDDVLQEILIKFPNALTPASQSDIKTLLSEYATPTKDGNWILKSQVKERISEHSEMIYYLAQLGVKAGFDVWIGIREQHEVYNGKRLSQLVTSKNPMWRFIPTTNRERVNQIDVIWHDDGRVRYEFEVENTTAITEAIVRGSNIPYNDIVRIIVIPEEREALLSRKMKEPMFSEQISKFGWKFMFYKDIRKVFEENKKTNKIDASKVFEKLFKRPQEARSKQTNLLNYVL